MPTLTINGTEYPAPLHSLLSDALPHHHAPELPCGGRGSCGKCRVVASGALSAPTAEERAHLSPAALAAGIRLACCARVEGDCSVTVAGAAVARQICSEGIAPSLSSSPLFSAYGAVIDLGTTTLAARLYGTSGLLAECVSGNPQARFGADVITRVGYSMEGNGGVLAACIRAALSDLLTELAAQAGISTAQIDALVVTGNTAMLYLLTQRDPACLSHAPFHADCLFGTHVEAQALGLPCPGAEVYLPPCVSAFVGADMVTALLSSGLCDRSETALLADVGTNGELALWHNGHLTCCSTAAGPAFEGAGLSMGMGGRSGAVDHLWLEDGFLRTHVLGDCAPVGICGSGVVDALACLLDLDLMDETGHLTVDPVVLALPVCLSQRDVRMVQLAKSAIHAGLCTLMRRAGLSDQEVRRLDIAGGFGSFLDVNSAGRIGLLPAALVPHVRVLGNAALSGAAMLLLDKTLCVRADALAATAETLDLASDPLFTEAYTEGMLFQA